MVGSERKTHPLVKPLCERLKRWKSEVGLITPPRLEEWLQDALEDSKSAGVEPDLVVFVIAICGWRFRICRPRENEIMQILKHRLNDSRYTPHPRFATDVFKTGGVSSAINEYVDQSLAKLWEPNASEEMNHLFRNNLQGKIEKLARELARPFLVTEYRRLQPRQGGYPDWGPWVAGTIVYRSAILHSPTEQDSKPLRAAEAVIGVMRGDRPDKSAFHRKRREILDRAPELFRVIMAGYQMAKTMKVQDKRILPLIDDDCWPPSIRQAGLSLLARKTKHSDQNR